MSCNTSNMYNTGFIPFNSQKIRLKQGLLPQKIVSDCNKITLNKCPNKYPITYPHPYPTNPIPMDCPCARFVSPP